jgi:hypothetical protein
VRLEPGLLYKKIRKIYIEISVDDLGFIIAVVYEVDITVGNIIVKIVIGLIVV